MDHKRFIEQLKNKLEETGFFSIKIGQENCKLPIPGFGVSYLPSADLIAIKKNDNMRNNNDIVFVEYDVDLQNAIHNTAKYIIYLETAPSFNRASLFQILGKGPQRINRKSYGVNIEALKRVGLILPNFNSRFGFVLIDLIDIKVGKEIEYICEMIQRWAKQP